MGKMKRYDAAHDVMLRTKNTFRSNVAQRSWPEPAFPRGNCRMQPQDADTTVSGRSDEITQGGIFNA
jgi:hypothetical protein